MVVAPLVSTFGWGEVAEAVVEEMANPQTETAGSLWSGVDDGTPQIFDCRSTRAV